MTKEKPEPGKASTAPPAEDADDRTLLSPLVKRWDAKSDAVDPATLPPLSAPPVYQDIKPDDRTLIAPVVKTPQATVPKQAAEDDRTLLGHVPARPVPTSQPPAASDTSARPPAQSESGSTYRPLPVATVTHEQDPGTKDQTVFAGTGQSAPPSSAAAQTPAHSAPAPGPLRTLEPGAVINNMYRVEERIDHGGMGRVFRGVEIGTGESVAIKVILPEMAEDPRVAQMFRREARTLRQLHHDAIVRYFAYVPPDANFNLHALVMGFIEGTKLSDKIRNDGPLDEKQTCQLFLRLAGGLDRAHKIGVVHRDLSPDNVMLPANDISKALLIDFGISRSSKVKDVTIGNEFAGKLKYVSPEQLGAFGGEADASSDVYSFALLMIVALTGKALPMGDSIVEAVQMRQSVPDLSGVPSKFQNLLYQMLQPDPAARMKTMEEVIEGLRAIDGGDAVTLGIATRTQSNRVVPGLQTAPRANTAREGFVNATPAVRQIPDLPQDQGGASKLILGLAIAAMLAGAAWYGSGMPGVPRFAEGDAGAADAPAGLARVSGTRETFLAEALSEHPCSLATLRLQGPNAGLIEAFAVDPKAIDGLATRFEAQFGMQPQVISQSVPSPQCAGLDFAKALQGTAGGVVEMSLDATTVTRGEGVVGTLYDDIAVRRHWLALVAPNGRTFSLMKQLAEPIGGQRRFSFRLPSAEPGVYMLIATASEEALVRAGAMIDGTAAGDLLPLMVRELSEDGQGAVAISVVEITR